MKELTGIILSGGKSLRMGADKAFIPFREKLLIEHSIEILKPFCSEILISANSEKYSSFGYKIVPDEIAGCGPIGGIYSALKKSTSLWNLIISCDTPFISNELITRLKGSVGDFDCLIPAYAGNKEPLVSMFHKKCLPDISEHIKAGNFKMHTLLEKLNCLEIDVSDLVQKKPDLFANFNSPEDILNR
ncbi:MAG: molybdenum cofactor guanylyltransferase [Prolixibacteraceae bacterium]|nr:molybdenum cofactor guanylyltransferase [Prolixibacteraceae bacterium]MBN2774177.1 molybdenum cofactor guanylyltransferase [Prolixibacteraceae bacterium]